jgi:hypothetical protein
MCWFNCWDIIGPSTIIIVHATTIMLKVSVIVVFV